MNILDQAVVNELFGSQFVGCLFLFSSRWYQVHSADPSSLVISRSCCFRLSVTGVVLQFRKAFGMFYFLRSSDPHKVSRFFDSAITTKVLLNLRFGKKEKSLVLATTTYNSHSFLC